MGKYYRKDIDETEFMQQQFLLEKYGLISQAARLMKDRNGHDATMAVGSFTIAMTKASTYDDLELVKESFAKMGWKFCTKVK